jgi:hypothetical protein
MKRAVRAGVALLACVASSCIGSSSARAQADETAKNASPAASFSDSEIFGPPSDRLKLESVTTRITAFDQSGYGYQSQAGPLLGPGSERTTILEPITEIVATQGDRLTHRVVIPVDIVTAASADALDKYRKKPDVLSHASRYNEAGAIDWTATYKTTATTDVSVRSAVHLEEPLRSWSGSLSATQTIADGDATLSESLLAVFDWFDQFDILGFRHGRTQRSTTTGSFGVTQILTETTAVAVNYGLSVQKGELGNTWNSVPLANGKRGAEQLPTERVRHAAVARVSQFLPWNGALHLYYRLYHDDWGITAHSIEGELMQRIAPFLYVSGLYRFHHQTGADFFTTLAPTTAEYRTADSDLAPLDADTIGGRVVVDVPLDARTKSLHFEAGYERYFRSNDLQVNVLTWETGYHF